MGKRRNRLNDDLAKLVYGMSAKSFEEKLLISSTLFMAVFNFVYVFANIMIGLGFYIVLFTILGFAFFSLLYLYFRFKSRPKIMYMITSITMLFYVDLGWLVNYGSNGPVFQFFIVLFSFNVLLFQRKHYLYFTLILVVNAIALLGFEYYYKGVIGNYPNDESRLFDNYIGFFVCILILLSFLSAIKLNYIREFDRAKMSDQLKSSFLANMSHEIRTPLNAIVGFSSLMAENRISDEEKRTYSTHLLNNSEYLLNLIEDIVDVSKIESNQLEIKLKDVDVVPLINQMVQSFQLSAITSKRVTVQSAMEMKSLMFKTDKARLEQIFRNLLTNALKFTEEGAIHVGCQEGKGLCTFFVRDTGVGILPEYKEVIFDRFMKIENSKKYLHRGTGIGLFLSKELVELMGGKIWVESEVGKGSTFYFTIPV